MKPLSSCALFGAVRALAGIKDALILQHLLVCYKEAIEL